MFFHADHRPYMKLNTPNVLGRYYERYQAARGAKQQFIELECYLVALDTAWFPQILCVFTLSYPCW